MLSIPDRNSHRTKLADWLELSAICSPDHRVGFGTLVSASDLGREEQPEDMTDDDIWEDDLVLTVQDEIRARRKIMAEDYPFLLDENGKHFEFLPRVTDAGTIYLFCLFLSHANDRTIIPKAFAPPVDDGVRDLFQACATFAAAGFVRGVAISFGWPRPQGEAFLAALQKVYKMFGDGKPHSTPRPAAPARVKDDGIDIIAWRPTVDQLPGAHYLLGQVASGDNWEGKSVVPDARHFHEYWFEHPPASPYQEAMFMPFCLEPKAADSTATPQEVLVDHVQDVTYRYGILFYRYRVAKYAADGLRLHHTGEYLNERIDALGVLANWVRNYHNKLKGATV